MKQLTHDEFNKIMKPIWEMERERRIRNRERDFARVCGWTGEAYWETAPLKDLIAEQNKYDREKK